MTSINFLSIYDLCKLTGSAESCQKYVVNIAPAAITAYLTAYDECVKVSGPEICRKLMSPEAQNITGALLMGLALGFLACWMMR